MRTNLFLISVLVVFLSSCSSNTDEMKNLKSKIAELENENKQLTVNYQNLEEDYWECATQMRAISHMSSRSRINLGKRKYKIGEKITGSFGVYKDMTSWFRGYNEYDAKMSANGKQLTTVNYDSNIRKFTFDYTPSKLGVHNLEGVFTISTPKGYEEYPGEATFEVVK